MLTQDSTVFKINMLLQRMSYAEIAKQIGVTKDALIWRKEHLSFEPKEMVIIDKIEYKFPFIQHLIKDRRYKR